MWKRKCGGGQGREGQGVRSSTAHASSGGCSNETVRDAVHRCQTSIALAAPTQVKGVEIVVEAELQRLDAELTERLQAADRKLEGKLAEAEARAEERLGAVQVRAVTEVWKCGTQRALDWAGRKPDGEPAYVYLAHQAW